MFSGDGPPRTAVVPTPKGLRMAANTSLNEPADTEPATESESATQPRPPRSLAVVRILLGWIFLWAFLDKAFGLGYNTPSGQGWIDGGSPTAGFFAGGTAGMFSGVAGQPWADWLFMIAQAGLGLGLILGVLMRLASIGGAVLMLALWYSMLPLETNPFVDPHLVFAAVMVAFVFTGAGDRWGLGLPWRSVGLVRRFPILR